MDLSFQAEALTKEEWKSLNSLAGISFLLLNSMENLRVALASQTQNITASLGLV